MKEGADMDQQSSLREDLATLAQDILADGSIDAEEVLRLRRTLFADGVIDRPEADFMFHLDTNSGENDPAWDEFFIEALTGYFVRQQQPAGMLSEEDAAFLADRVQQDGKIELRTEFELLVNVIGKCDLCPDKIVMLALKAVKDSVLEGGGVLFGPTRRRRGVIDAADVAALEKVIYGTGGENGFAIGRAEAETLFDLNDATVEKENDPTWQDLFARAIGNYLMFPRSGHENARHGEAERRQAIDADEAAWLIDRIERDDVLHDNERALLEYIKSRATSVHASLTPLFERSGV